MNDRLTSIIIENGALQKLPRKAKTLGKAFAIITDQHLKRLGEEILHELRRVGLTANLLIVPAGETTKSLAFVEKMARSLIKLGIKRDSVLIGLGGGVIGDTAGFLASIYMRGISFISIPTTLLAMCDSSIGGKTGVDLPDGKNLLGTFREPNLILMDPLLLKTLPEREFCSGLAEIVKHGVIADRSFFFFLEKNAKGILARKPALLKKIIQKSVAIKLRIIRADPYESVKKTSGASRMLVNYGHTVGHALEQLSHYELSHGEAISIGMVAENRVAVGKKYLKENEANRILNLLKVFRLPVKFPKEYSTSEIKQMMALDKKNLDGKLHFALPMRIGKAKIVAL
ncbi:3-dehydroquinate synthase [Candidatus Peregrinibacteria bacterium]|nr:3-dehydroquinate synthase [Candidatus Peregrinibacteria bacterium]